jgi:hypothetical protein
MPIGLRDVWIPICIRQPMEGMLALRAGRPLPSKVSGYTLLVEV